MRVGRRAQLGPAYNKVRREVDLPDSLSTSARSSVVNGSLRGAKEQRSFKPQAAGSIPAGRTPPPPRASLLTTGCRGGLYVACGDGSPPTRGMGMRVAVTAESGEAGMDVRSSRMRDRRATRACRRTPSGSGYAEGLGEEA